MLPYWAILLADTIIVFVSVIFIYWVTNRTLVTFEHRFSVLYSSFLFAVISWVGVRAFKTYAGVVRYSSFVDLLKVAYANSVTLVLALVCSVIFRKMGVAALSALSPLEAVVSSFKKYEDYTRITG